MVDVAVHVATEPIGDAVGNVILGLLILAPQTLYSLNKHFERGISLFYRASNGALQNALKTLLAKGHVTFVEGIEGGRNKKTYSITDAGRSAFGDWIRSPVAGGDLEVAVLLKLYLLGLVDDDAERAAVLDDLLTAIERQAEELSAFAEEVDGVVVPERYARVFRYQRATLEYGLRVHGAGIAWFRELVASERGRGPVVE